MYLILSSTWKEGTVLPSTTYDEVRCFATTAAPTALSVGTSKCSTGLIFVHIVLTCLPSINLEFNFNSIIQYSNHIIQQYVKCVLSITTIILIVLLRKQVQYRFNTFTYGLNLPVFKLSWTKQSKVSILFIYARRPYYC